MGKESEEMAGDGPWKGPMNGRDQERDGIGREGAQGRTAKLFRVRKGLDC